jgi:spore germination protein
MNNKRKGLSNFQVSAIVTHSIIGLAIMFLPRRAAVYAGIDGAIATLLAGVVTVVLVVLVAILSMRHPCHTIIEYSKLILGKYLGFAYGLFIVFYTLLTASFILRGFADAMKILLLPRTPLEVIMICMILICLYCVHGGIITIARICEIFLFPVLVVIGITIVFNMPDVQLFRYRESFSHGFKPIIMGIFNIMLAYQGYEVLFFLVPFMNNSRKALYAGTGGLIIPVVVYTSLVFMAIGVIGALPTAELVFPTIHLARRIGTDFFERFDIFFLVFWILSVFTSIVIYLYMASLSLTRLFNLYNYKPFIFILIPVCYAIAMLPQNISQINILSDIINFSGILFTASSIPLLILSIIRKKRG